MNKYLLGFFRRLLTPLAALLFIIIMGIVIILVVCYPVYWVITGHSSLEFDNFIKKLFNIPEKFIKWCSKKT